MRNILVALTSVIMVAYVLYRSFATLVILPLTESLFNKDGFRFLLLILLAAGATALSFTRRKGIAASIAAVVGLLALGLWCRVIFVAPVWTWSDFIWFVLPEVCFSLAVLTNWLVQRPREVGRASDR
jgi:hypothetical protein